MQRYWRQNACFLRRFVPESQHSAAGECPAREGKLSLQMHSRQKQMTSVSHISLGFYSPSCEGRALPHSAVGRSGQAPARARR